MKPLRLAPLAPTSPTAELPMLSLVYQQPRGALGSGRQRHAALLLLPCRQMQPVYSAGPSSLQSEHTAPAWRHSGIRTQSCPAVCRTPIQPLFAFQPPSCSCCPLVGSRPLTADAPLAELPGPGPSCLRPWSRPEGWGTREEGAARASGEGWGGTTRRGGRISGSRGHRARKQGQGLHTLIFGLVLWW